ncbi:putative signaling protein PA1727 [Paraliobacillus ryukyuensis]|uniref:EAL domain-containing protein (Putative c-di-GMP-specific phosphodiesterase class I) n=1 Tax=Paraliobacillus ryukyuensis TaxID=200904 RepID=A0A366EDC9_9BACI|nr:EAL domain-containing protein [Paraliobacillus ryukyuensis]RBP00323.1 EAL domain-containing protein (putative c-di-GMP-specific phosphodiesterase class I) [Paraliobacillus ryukyuensis]
MFKQPDPNYYVVLEGHYQWVIVLISIAIVWFAAYVAITSNQRIVQHSFFSKSIWILFSSIAMGIGIWAMHFIGMSAFMMPLKMSYNHLLTILSIVPAFGASFLAFYLVNRNNRSPWLNIGSAIVMGLGISSMHYIGMESMVMEAKMVYTLEIFVLSIIIAIVVSFIAIYILSSLQERRKRAWVNAGIAVLLAVAVSSMHYVGMFGTKFYVPTEYISSHHQAWHMDMNLLIAGVFVSVFILLLLFLVSIFLDRYIDYRVRFFDLETRLPNGRYYERELQKNRNSQAIAVWQINDLDKVNNEYGYETGDKLVQFIAKTLRMVRIPSVTLYRMESNRFAFLTHRDDQLSLLQEEMAYIAKRWKRLTFADSELLELKSSCSIACIEDSVDVNKLYNDALTVFEHPSTMFQQEVVRYDPAIHRFSFDQKISEDLDQAMEADELFLVYQPKVSSDDGKVKGFEALVRWEHPTFGFLSPGVFIPILEHSNRIFDLTDWVIETVYQQLLEWNKELRCSINIAINIPGDYVSSQRLLEKLTQMKTTYNINAKIELEVTETSFVSSIETANHSISQFRELGFSVALDDFGTGLSSLSYLKQMAITTLKIDKSFVDRVPESEKDANILKAIINLGQSLGLQVVIEGVETKTQVTYLQEIASSFLFQGYYFSKPMEAAKVIEWIKTHELN